MKVISSQAMSELETKAYQQGFLEKDFMENAGKGIAFETKKFIEDHQLPPRAFLLCGKGNNGGDAFVAGRYLLEQNIEVIAIQLEDLSLCSPLCKQNALLFLEKRGKVLHQFQSFSEKGVILDGLFGTGFRGKIGPPYNLLVEAANQSRLPILSIDIPSGLDGTNGKIEGNVIQATETIFLGLPKTGFFLGEGWNITGKLRFVDFGLPHSLSEDISPAFCLLTQERVTQFLPPIKRNRHKYQAGHVVGLAGSKAMPGAALMSSLAAFRGGCGIVRLLYPKGMEVELSSSPYELIKMSYDAAEPQPIFDAMQRASAVFIGPGLGRDNQVQNLLQKLAASLDLPCVIDADALTIFAHAPFRIPPHTIFTPHMGEMQTLLKRSEHLTLNFELLQTCQKYAEEHKITLILKGAPTFIFHPGKPIFVNPTGDPGMATAGSGDVLTGLLTALLAQGLDCHSAALFGVYLHGLSGELAAEQRGTSYGVMATDLIAHFANAYSIIPSSSNEEIK